MKLKSSLMAAAAAAVFAAPVAANQFSRYDLNRDGNITQSEWNRAMQQQYTFGGQASQGATAGQSTQGRSAIVPGQGITIVTVTPIDPQLAAEQRRESLFRSLDTNNNGVISAREAGLNTRLLTAFAQLDRDDDGVIDRREFTRVHVQDQGQGQAMGQGQDMGQGQAMGQGQQARQQQAQQQARQRQAQRQAQQQARQQARQQGQSAQGGTRQQQGQSAQGGSGIDTRSSYQGPVYGGQSPSQRGPTSDAAGN